jgi:phage repressor protein C with HTH and peptisase S24 domain
MTDLFKRLDIYLNFKGLNDNQVTVETGISNGIIGKARKRGALSQENISKLLNTYRDLDANWLFTGMGEMLELSKNNYSGVHEENTAYKGNKKDIPLIPIEAMAGMGGGNVSISENDILDRYVIPDFTDVDFMIRIKGSSMEPNFNSGDVIACKIIKERSFFQWGRVFVVHHQEQGTMVKRLFPNLEKGSVECKSDNIKYPPFILSLKEVTNIALVKGVIRLE